jgi:hypothetical protein
VLSSTFLASFYVHIRLWGEGGERYYLDSQLQLLMQYYLLLLTNTAIIKKTTYIFYSKQICRNKYILVLPNSLATATVQTTDSYVLKGRWLE